MAVDRPTFSESWYRVSDMKPRLRSTVQTYRQHYRGEMWHVVRDPGNNQFFRLNDAAYFVVGMLDGNRTVDQVWQIANAQLGDQAPTQGEVIQLLGQLYTSNLLASEVSADAAGMFDRHKKRVRREVKGYMQNMLFIRIPLYDPDAFLNRWVSIFGLVFTKWSLIPWLMMMLAGIVALSGRFDDLAAAGRSENLLNPQNLIWLYLAMALIKLIHEFGHAFACKKFGRDRQSGGEVHTMGIMFLVFMPVPYVDATSSWALRSKWQRVTIAAAGIYVELFIAAIAAIIWARTQPGTIHSLMFNIMFIASVSTILFNGNPLLRFDAYYILSDFLEIANMAQRGKDFIYYIVKRYAYGVEKAQTPAHTPGEAFWLPVYGVVSAIYRVFICFSILLFVAGSLFFVGALLAIAAVVMWVLVPLGKWMHYLFTSPQLLRCRRRAAWTTIGAAAILFVLLGILPAEEHVRAPGILQPRNIKNIFMTESGFIRTTLASDIQVSPDSQPLVVAQNRQLVQQRDEVQITCRRLINQIRMNTAEGNTAAVQSDKEFLAALEDRLALFNKRIEWLNVLAPIEGTWISWEMEYSKGAYLQRGAMIGRVADMRDLVIVAVADQQLGPRVENEVVSGDHAVQVRVRGRPDILFTGHVEDVYDAAKGRLEHESLSFTVQGGDVQTATDDPTGTKTAEQYFDVRIGRLVDKQGQTPQVYAGQRVIVRFNMGLQPLALQWWRKIRQLVQRRFHMTI